MNFLATTTISPLAVWTSRVALFSVGLAAAGVFLHRLFGMATPVALNIFTVSFAGAVLALVLGAMATVVIWRDGSSGAARVLIGVLVALALLAWPLSMLPVMAELPAINDVTTDTKSPPAFDMLAKRRGPGANPADYRGESFAVLQQAAYSDLVPITIDRASTEALEVSAEALRRLGMTIVAERTPDPETGRPGLIEAEEQTMILGFVDDVAIRVSGDVSQSRIDVRSASRFGRHDFGRNAERVRRVLREIVVRLESTVPSGGLPANVTLKSREERAEQVKTRKKRSRRSRRRRPQPFFFP